MLAIADPVYDQQDAHLQGNTQLAQCDDYQLHLMRAVEDQHGSVFPRLQETARLPTQLKDQYGRNVESLTGLAATESNLRERLRQPFRYQVFATHGILDKDIPYIQEPALVLSQVGLDKQDNTLGFLTLTESWISN